MADVCFVCKRNTGKNANILRCSGRCANNFHAACAGIEQDVFSRLSQAKKMRWVCETCQSTLQSRTRSNSSNSEQAVGTDKFSLLSPEIDADGVLSASVQEKPDLRISGELKSFIVDTITELMQKQQHAIIKHMDCELGSSINLCHTQLLEIKKEMSDLVSSIKSCQDDIQKLYRENTLMTKEIEECKTRIADLEQYSRCNMIEISGVPERNPENLLNVLSEIGRHLDIDVDKKFVDIIHRVSSRNPTRKQPGTILVKFLKKSDKEQFLTRARIKRGLSAIKLGFDTDNQIYINDNLSFHYRKLHATARELRKINVLKYVWFKNGKLLVRETDGSEAVIIKSLADLDRFKVSVLSDHNNV